MSKMYECNSCNYSINKKSSFISHLQSNKHRKNKLLLKCKYCNLIVNSDTILKNHMSLCIENELEKKDAVIEEQKEKISKLKETNTEYMSIIRQFVKSRTAERQHNIKYVNNNYHNAENFDDFLKLTVNHK